MLGRVRRLGGKRRNPFRRKLLFSKKMTPNFLDVVLQLQNKFLDYMISATTLGWDGRNLEELPIEKLQKRVKENLGHMANEIVKRGPDKIDTCKDKHYVFFFFYHFA